MKTQRTGWTLLLLLIAVLPCAADGHKAGEEEQEDTVLGTWYAQYADGEVVPAAMTMRLDIKEDGTMTGTMVMEGEEPEVELWTYTHDKKNAKLTLYELDEDGNAEAEIEVELSYSFVDDMLIFRFQEDPDEEVQSIEMTREREGTERHQKLREEMGKEQGPRNRAERAVEAEVEAAAAAAAEAAAAKAAAEEAAGE